MKRSRIRALVAVVLSAGVACAAYSQTAPKDVLPPTTVAHPPVSPTLNVTTPGTVAAPSPALTTITPQVPAPPAQSVPQLPTPEVVKTNKLPAAPTGEALSPGSAQTSLWTRTNAAPSSAWDETTAAVSPVPSAAKPTTNLWSAPPPNANLWTTGTPTGVSGIKTDWK